jgi:hypothetical protein
MAPAYPTSAQLRYDSHSFVSTVYLRKYFLYDGKIGIRTGPYAQYSYSQANNTYVDPTNNNTYQNRAINAGLGLEIVYFPTKKLGLSSSVGSLTYSHNTNDQTNYDHNKSNFIALNLSSALNLSIFYSLGK